jgi:hypothetical protein
MKQLYSALTVCALMVAACSTDREGDTDGSGKPTHIAGGQSGNDGTGSYGCDVSDAAVSDTPVDVAPMDVGCSPVDVTSRLRRATRVKAGEADAQPVVFDCGTFGRYVVEVAPATAAQLQTGRLLSDTGTGVTDQVCLAYVVQSRILVRSLDGGEPFEAQEFSTPHICWNAKVDAKRADGATLLGWAETLTEPTLRLSIHSTSADAACTPTSEPNPPQPTNGGAAATGGASPVGYGGAGTLGGAGHEQP